MVISLKRLLIVPVVVAGVLAVALATMLTPRNMEADTSLVRKTIGFYKDGTEWFADVAGHTQAQNQMVAGADLLLDAVADGSNRVTVVLSSDVENPDEWVMHLHIVEHDKYGAAYRVRVKGSKGSRLIWLCNVMHTVFGGEHPTDIYIHSISR